MVNICDASYMVRICIDGLKLAQTPMEYGEESLVPKWKCGWG